MRLIRVKSATKGTTCLNHLLGALFINGVPYVAINKLGILNSTWHMGIYIGDVRVQEDFAITITITIAHPTPTFATVTATAIRH
jgi:hypothetical protein